MDLRDPYMLETMKFMVSRRKHGKQGAVSSERCILLDKTKASLQILRFPEVCCIVFVEMCQIEQLNTNIIKNILHTKYIIKCCQ